MIATKCAPSFGFASPFFRPSAKVAMSACIWSVLSSRTSFRFTPCLHMALPGAACLPPLASIIPIWAFQAQW